MMSKLKELNSTQVESLIEPMSPWEVSEDFLLPEDLDFLDHKMKPPVLPKLESFLSSGSFDFLDKI